MEKKEKGKRNMRRREGGREREKEGKKTGRKEGERNEGRKKGDRSISPQNVFCCGFVPFLAFISFTVFTLTLQSILSGSHCKNCGRTVLVPNISRLGINNLSRRSLIMSGLGCHVK